VAYFFYETWCIVITVQNLTATRHTVWAYKRLQ